MSKTINPTDTAVADALSRFNIEFSIVSVAPNSGHNPEPIDRDGWKCFPWRFTLTNRSARPLRQYSGDYFTGTGHVERKHKLAPVRLVRPSAATVLSSLLLDSSAADQSFNDWCADFGADSDSIKALSTYQLCCAIGVEMRKLFTQEQRAELETLLQDY